MKAFQPEQAVPATTYSFPDEAELMMLLGLLSLGVAAYLMLQYLDHQPPRRPSFHNYRMDFGKGGNDGHSVTEALSKLFLKYG